MQTKYDNIGLNVYRNPLVLTCNDNRLGKPLLAQLISNIKFGMILRFWASGKKLLRDKGRIQSILKLINKYWTLKGCIFLFLVEFHRKTPFIMYVCASIHIKKKLNIHPNNWLYFFYKKVHCSLGRWIHLSWFSRGSLDWLYSEADIHPRSQLVFRRVFSLWLHRRITQTHSYPGNSQHVQEQPYQCMAQLQVASVLISENY